MTRPAAAMEVGDLSIGPHLRSQGASYRNGLSVSAPQTTPHCLLTGLHRENERQG